MQCIPADDKREKVENKFGNALESFDAYWDGKLHDSFLVTSEGIYTLVENSSREQSQ